jgi:hypothetical protein
VPRRSNGSCGPDQQARTSPTTRSKRAAPSAAQRGARASRRACAVRRSCPQRCGMIFPRSRGRVADGSREDAEADSCVLMFFTCGCPKLCTAFDLLLRCQPATGMIPPVALQLIYLVFPSSRAGWCCAPDPTPPRRSRSSSCATNSRCSNGAVLGESWRRSSEMDYSRCLAHEAVNAVLSDDHCAQAGEAALRHAQGLSDRLRFLAGTGALTWGSPPTTERAPAPARPHGDGRTPQAMMRYRP